MFFTKAKKIVTGAVVATLAFGWSGTAFAATTDTTTTQVGIQAGGLSLDYTGSTTVDFGTVTLNGTTQTVTAGISKLTVGDATGTGSGWHVSASASQFTEVGGAGLKIPKGSLKLAAPSTIAATGGTTSPAPTIKTGAPWSIDDGSSYMVVSAAVGQGMGNYDVTFPAVALTLTIDPSLVKADTVNYPATPTPYGSTVTWSIVSGP